MSRKSKIVSTNNTIIGFQRSIKKEPDTIMTNHGNLNFVKLNVGGTHFATLKETLSKRRVHENVKPNLFENYMNGQENPIYDENNAIFIDRNPKCFEIILQYLRRLKTTFEYPLDTLDDDVAQELLMDAEYYGLNDLEDDIYYTYLKSELLYPNYISAFFKLCELEIDEWKLLYRASIDGFGANHFHDKCDGYSGTLIIIKTQGDYILGGYTVAMWKSCYKNCVVDENVFVFSMKNNTERTAFIECTGVEHSSEFGPSFPGFFTICNNSDLICGSFSDYENIDLVLTETQQFKVAEIEVFTYAD